MGDRSNVFIQQELTEGQWTGIGLYSHWGGEDMQATALQAAVESTKRLGDESYFARRVIHKVLNSVDPDAAETGHGLWTVAPPDNEYPVLVINSQTGAYWYVPDGITDNGVHHVHLPAPAETKNLQ
jgi:hypothetical protein